MSEPNCVDHLRNNQGQADMDGVMVTVSRQALEESLEYIATLRAKVAELEAVAAPFEQLARDKLFTDSNLGRPDDCGAFGSDNITVTLGDCRRLIAAFDTPLTEEITLPDHLKDPKAVLERGQELLDTKFNPPEDKSDEQPG